MKKLLMAVLGASLTVGVMGAAQASPEQDRKEILEYFKNKFPNVKFEDYVHGAFVFSPDAFAQYQAIMELPPFVSVIEQGKKMWETPFKNGKTYASCFPNGGKNIAGLYPYFDEQLGKAVTFEMAINACRKANGEEEYSYSDMKTMGVLTAYARTLSDGMKMQIKVEGPRALEAYERGKQHFFQRRGQLNFSCATCHIQNAGNLLRTEYLSPVLGQATHWPVFRAGENLVTLQVRYEGCNRQVRAKPFKPGSEEYNNLEYFHSYISNGLPMQASVFRK
jgi:sulfur-oxidizing protein SoxA